MKAFLFSFSLSNLLFYKVYSGFFAFYYGSPNDKYYLYSQPLPIDHVATIANIVIMTMVIWPISHYALEGSRRILQRGCRILQLILVLAAAFWILRIHNYVPTGLLDSLRQLAVFLSIARADIVIISASLGLLAVACLGYLFSRIYRHHFVSGFVVPVVLLAPFGLVTVVQMANWAFQYEPMDNFANRESTSIPRKETLPKSRVVIVIFDELDFRLGYYQRPSSLSLPELDRLASQSLFATNAYAPSDSTTVSIPSITTGLMVSSVTPTGLGDLLLRPVESGPTKRWNETPNLFSRAQAAGISVALVGWHIPYCVIFRHVLASCLSLPGTNRTNSIQGTLTNRMIGQARSLAETSNFSPFGQSLFVEHAARRYVDLLEAAVSVVGDKQFGLVYLHFSIPHEPNLFDSSSGKLTLKNAPLSGYMENLALVDITVGRLRAQLEKMGQWDESTVLLTSDHWWRKSMQFDGKVDQRVPFVIKLPHQQERFDYNQPFNTVSLFELSVDMLLAKTQGPKDVVNWLDHKTKHYAPVKRSTSSELH